MERFNIRMEDADVVFRCRTDQSVLEASETGKFTDPSFVSMKTDQPIFVGCRRGGCGTCKVEVLSGTYEKKKMSRSYVSAEEEESGVVMSCRIYPTSDMVLRFVGLRSTRRPIFFPAVTDTSPAGPDVT